MATYMVDSAQIAESAAQVGATGEAIRTEVQVMLANLEALQGTWGGVAAAAFAECADQWRLTQAQVEETLDLIAQRLASASHVYAQAEDQSLGLFAGA